MNYEEMRIATWNLERPQSQQLSKIEGLQTQLRSVDADIWILTETNACVSPGSNYGHQASVEITGCEKYWPGENRTTIWSRLPIIRSVPTHDPETAVCVEVDLGGASVLIYGTIIPYHAAATKYPYRFEGADVTGKKSWELHYKSIASHAAEWCRLRHEFPDHHMVVAGDFNQNRDGRRWYGTKQGREQLGTTLSDAGIVCVTEGEVTPVGGDEQLNPVIDHICLDQGLAERITDVHGWTPGVTSTGKRLSDHSGIAVDVASR